MESEHVVDDSYRRYPPSGFGAILSAARRRRGWSQRTAAEAAGISNGYLAMLETDRRAPSQTVAAALILALRIDGNDRLAVFSAAVDDAGRDYPGRDRNRWYPHRGAA